PLREAKDSSAIENIVTTDDKLFHHAAMQEKDADPGTKETLRYRRALLEGYRNIRSRPLSTATAVKVCQTIRGVELNVRNTSGTALKNTVTDEIIYTPPKGEQLLFKILGNWETFLHEKTDIDPLIRMAVGHYQFEAIHPFTDGNGRTGRLLNILFLIGENLLDIPVLYLSRYIIENKDDYYRLLQEVTEKKHWEPWIVYMLMAVEKTAKWTTEKIRAIKDLMEHTSSYTSTAKPNVYTRELIELTFIQPYCRIVHVIDAGIAQRATASKYLKELSAIGVLKEITIGRDKVFIHPKFLNLLIRKSSDFPLYGS
ncbi:MAG: Fic family protein, partial [Candidatus Krumholzibacteria bacterium]